MSSKWVMTNGTIEMDVCTVCGQPYREGHIDCTCPSNHAERCERPTYDQLKAQHDAQPATLAALATGAALIRRVLADGTNEIREYHVPQLEDFADELEASLSLAGLPRCSVVLMECENWIDEPTMECITHGGKFPAAQATGGESDEFIRGSISGAKNAVATERLRRKLMPSDDGALEYQLERFEEAFRWLVDGRADGAINMQMAIAKMRTAIEAPRHTNSSEELTDD